MSYLSTCGPYLSSAACRCRKQSGNRDGGHLLFSGRSTRGTKEARPDISLLNLLRGPFTQGMYSFFSHPYGRTEQDAGMFGAREVVDHVEESPSTSTHSAITCTSPSSAPVRMMG